MPLRETPLWLNPCGDVSSDAVSSQLPQFQGVSNLDLFRQILIQAKNALSQAEGRKKEFVTEYFQVDYDRHTDEWKSSSSSYDWLPNFDKDIGEKATVEHLESLTADVDGTLSRVYTDLQKIAVGLEQLAADHKAMNTQFQSMFRTAEYDLRALLCEIQVALEEHKVNRPLNITREIMSDEIRHIVGNRDRSIRDWIIYRDYMNSLEYIIDLMEFYVKKEPPHPAEIC